MFHPLKRLLQQAPPSKLQPALLFSSSHHLSTAHCGDPQLDAEVVVVVLVVVIRVVVVVGIEVVVELIETSKHLQSCSR